MADVTLRLGDCLDILPTLAPASFGAIVTDPPYGISHTSNHGASWQGRGIANDDDTACRDAVLAIARERELPWAAFGSWKAKKPIGVRGVLIWDKGPAFGMGDLSFPWKMSWEEIYVGGKGWSGRRDEGVLRGAPIVSWESRGRVHPHQKPEWLICRLIEKLPTDCVILDPFMGSGTTGVACVQTGRNFIGIECDAGYFAIAEKRIAEAQRSLL